MNRLTHVHIEGFKSIREADLDLRPLNVLIGANASGKSSFLSLFRMLNFTMTQGLQLYIGRFGGAESLLHYGSRTTPQMMMTLHYETPRGANRYHARLFHAAADTLVFADESVAFTPIGMGGYGPEKLEQLGSGHKESKVPEAGHQDVGVAQAAFGCITSWRFYQFHDTSETAAIRKESYRDDNRYLRDNAGNLSAYLYGLRETAKPHYDRIVHMVRLAFPEFGDFAIEPLALNDRNVILNWREVGREQLFGPHVLSDGTLRFMALAALLLQPDDRLPAMIVIDEPELGLHPSAIELLGGMLRSVAALTQVIVATQCARLVDEFETQDIVVTERREGATTFRRLDPEPLADWLEDYSIGELWEKNVVGGRP